MDSKTSKTCSFCGVEEGPGVHLSGGLGAMICDVCLGSLHEQRQAGVSAAGSLPAREEMSDADLLSLLPRILGTSDQARGFAREWVDLLRERGVSWAAIGQVLGVSRQAAWARFSATASQTR